MIALREAERKIGTDVARAQAAPAPTVADFIPAYVVRRRLDQELGDAGGCEASAGSLEGWGQTYAGACAAGRCTQI